MDKLGLPPRSLDPQSMTLLLVKLPGEARGVFKRIDHEKSGFLMKSKSVRGSYRATKVLTTHSVDFADKRG